MASSSTHAVRQLLREIIAMQSSSRPGHSNLPNLARVGINSDRGNTVYTSAKPSSSGKNQNLSNNKGKLNSSSSEKKQSW